MKFGYFGDEGERKVVQIKFQWSIFDIKICYKYDKRGMTVVKKNCVRQKITQARYQ